MSAARAATFTVTNNNDSGAGSFRQALLDANATAGADSIVFNVGVSGLQTIPVLSDLPRISEPVVIDATTQPGYTGNPLIELKGTGAQFGLIIDAGNTTIRGFIINNFHSTGISMFTSGGNVIQNNFIGTNSAGTAAQTNFGFGIQLGNSSNNTIGGDLPNTGNVIAGNSSTGITVNGANASNNVIQGNYIGVNATGTAVIANGRAGICLCSSNPDFNVTNNLIGGTAPGAGNVIAGNDSNEIEINGFASVGNSVQGNLIGTNAAGTQALVSTGIGIYLTSATRNNIIGGSTASARNLIAGNNFGSSGGGSGIALNVNASGNVIKGNFIGTDITGTQALPNQVEGIVLSDGAHDNIIGGTAAGEGNVVAFNGTRGISGSNSTTQQQTNRNAIRGNSIFSNGSLGIELFPGNGVTPNDSCDADAGANNLQNFPVLTSALQIGSSVTVRGSLNSTSSSNFAIDFFASPSADASGFGEGKIYIGTINVTTDGACNTAFTTTLTLHTGRFITATATDGGGNTSEFSQALTAVKSVFDFDGDGKTDVGIFRPSDGSWWYTRSSASDFRVFAFGTSSDIITPGDYTGDGLADIAIFRPSTGEWFVQRSEDNSYFSFPFGSSGDIPAPADYDNDGKTDAAVFRPSSGTWFILNSGGSGTSIVPFGSSEDKPVPADFDGDGKADIAIFRPSDGSWWYLQSSNSQFKVYRFGVGTDKPVQGDYTGDGKADIAIFRPSTGEWYFQRSEDNSYFSVPFGAAGDIAAPGDYDGDGKFDTAVFRPSTADWFVQRSSAGILITSFGTNGDRPIPNSFVP
ncbi:MAG TPA: FG-GAP-like repeat-containing protein [Pyrinomonadaceae bacterium]